MVPDETRGATGATRGISGKTKDDKKPATLTRAGSWSGFPPEAPPQRDRWNDLLRSVQALALGDVA